MIVNGDAMRLFFALWPDDAVRGRLVATADTALNDAKGRRVPADNLHVTLAFLGSIAPDTRGCIKEAAGEVTVSPFELVLDRLDYQRHAQIYWLSSAYEPPALLGLVSVLRTAIAGCALPTEVRPFRTHLTLMREARGIRDVRAIEPIKWRVNEFVLVRSRTLAHGAQYEVLQSWKLAGAAAP